MAFPFSAYNIAYLAAGCKENLMLDRVGYPLCDPNLSGLLSSEIEAAELLLKIILKKDDIQVISVVGQWELQSPIVGGRDIRLDILAKGRKCKTEQSVGVHKKSHGKYEIGSRAGRKCTWNQ